MSNVKERIFGAVTIMSDEDAEKVWNLIQATFLLNNVEEVTPDPDEIAALNAYHSGDLIISCNVSGRSFKGTRIIANRYMGRWCLT